MNRSQIAALFSFYYDNADPRIRDKFLMGHPYFIASIYACYVVIILWILPKIWENRKAVNYRKFMTIVDVILCIRSTYFLTNFSYLWISKYNWSCQPIDRSGSWLSTYEMRICYEFVLTKFIYTLQSVVFVMSKKNTPVATYLLIHHTWFPLMLWTCANAYPGGHIMFIGFINSIVHFSVTAMRIVCVTFPECALVRYQKNFDVYLHIFQFISIIFHSSQLLFLQDCSVPKIYAYLEISATLTIAYIYKYFVLNSWKRKTVKEKRLDVA